jgi:hypothetical protein
MAKIRDTFLLLLLGLVLTACASEATSEIAPEDVAVDPTSEPALAATLLPRSEPLVDNCLACHTDKEQLVALATESEDAHGSESEGVG